MARTGFFGRVQRLPVALPTALVAACLCASGAAARDRRPLPEPMPCPIDAPVRVASEDSLKYFSVALEACDATATIVAPALHLPVAPVMRIESEPEVKAIDAATPVIASRERTRRRAANASRTADASRTVVVATVAVEDGVRAALPVAMAVAETPGTMAGTMSDAAILSLRPRSYQTAFDAQIAAAAMRHGVDPLMLHAVITQESRYRSNAISHAGARGLMQVMPGTGRMLGVNPSYLLDPATNIDAGAKLLRRIWSRFGGRFDLVLAAYNAGDGAVIKYGYRVPPYRETQGYVVRVKAIYAKLAAESGLSVPGL